MVFFINGRPDVRVCLFYLYAEGWKIEKIKLYFTTDLRQIQDTLAKTLIEFKLDETTNKYKVEDVELKLLDM